ncbi:retention module-containing protein [Thauera aromatica]|uniref:LapA adhesin domain-containing protein n=1 Tax=Thauera aromatica K172 TaxID=44139 RepID=A0A2R4BQS3_THAAR|nr:retention module-containing protein [Thauera aromatica]AVR89685.1 hypothetical protein Tharo_2803 [Thauera aromatica K172]
MAQVIATVVSVIGEAFVRDAQGNTRSIKPGDALLEGETVITSAGGQVELAMADGSTLMVVESQVVGLGLEMLDEGAPGAQESAVSAGTVDEVLQALETGENIDELLEAPAAGLAGGADAEGSSFVRLLRIAEETTGVDYDYSFEPQSGLVPEPGDAVETVTGTVSLNYVLLDDNGQPLLGPDGNFIFVDGNDVIEGTPIGVLATVDVAPAGSDLVLSLSNGLVITIPVGQTTGVAVLETRPDDLFIQGTDTLPISVVGASGGGYDELDAAQSSSANIVDDNDPVFAVISVNLSSVGEGEVLTYTVRLVDQAGNPVTVPEGGNVDVQLTWSGPAANPTDAAPLPTTVTILGGTSQTVFQVNAVNDSVNEPIEPLIAVISEVVDAQSIFENLGASELPAESEIIDNDVPDIEVAGVGTQGVVVTEGQAAVFSVTENNETFTLTGTLSSLGDTYSDTATATILDNDVVPTINPSALAVSEEGLPGGLADLVGMDDTTNLAVRSGSIDYSSNGAAALTVALLTDGLPGSLGNTAIVWSHEGGNEAIVVGQSGGGEDLIRIVLNDGIQAVDTNSPTIAYSVELLKPLEHLGVNVEDDLSFDIDVRLSDGANSAQTAALTITVEDDSPLEAGTDAVVLNIPPVSFDGQLAFIGADTGGASGAQWTASLSTLNGLGLTSGGRAVVFSYEDGQTLLVAETTEGEPVFTVRANADGTYSFNSLAPLDLSSLNLDDATVSSGGGPKSTYYWYDDGSLTNVLDASKDLVVSITGYKDGALADVNPSGAGIGIQNNEFDDGERFVFDFDAAGSDGEANLAYAVRFELFQYGAGDSFQVTGMYQDGTSHVDGYSIETIGGTTYMVVTAESGKYFDTLEVAMSDGKVKIQGLETYVLEDAPPQLVTLDFTAVDADGDEVDGDIVLTFQNQPDPEGGIVGNAMFGGAEPEPDASADSDVFVWSLGDQGTADSPAIDRVDFDVEDGDVLDLRDLLPDDAGDSLSSYLSFGSMEGKLALLVDHDGGGTFETTQAIVFENYASTAELASALELDAGWTEADILNRMIADGQLKS